MTDAERYQPRVVTQPATKPRTTTTRKVDAASVAQVAVVGNRYEPRYHHPRVITVTT